MAGVPKNPEQDARWHKMWQEGKGKVLPSTIAKAEGVSRSKVADGINRHQLREIRKKVADRLIEKKEIYIPDQQRKTA